MSRGSHILVELQRLTDEASEVYRSIVRPGWLGPMHGMPDTLFGYLMGTFARIDLASAYWHGSFETQTERMVSFMTTFMCADRHANSLAVQTWRHKLMHTAAPRTLKDSKSGVAYRWLLHWGDEQLPRDQHFKFQSGGANLNLSLFGLLDDLRLAVEAYLKQLSASPPLQAKYDAVAKELESYEFRHV